MTIAVVQSKSGEASTVGVPASSLTVTYDASTDTDNTLLLIGTCEGAIGGKHIILPSGWTERGRGNAGSSDGPELIIATRAGTGTALAVQLTYENNLGTPVAVETTTLIIAEIAGEWGGIGTLNTATSGSSQSLAGVTPGPGIEALIVHGTHANNAYGLNDYPSGYINDEEIVADVGHSIRSNMLSLYESSTTSGAYGGTLTYAGGLSNYVSASFYFTELPVIGIDFTATPATGNAPLLVAFDSTAIGGTPSAYLWDFGDGDTSTSADPTHTFDDPGVYSVVLTATIAGDDYIADMTIVVSSGDFTPPAPGNAILEIKVSDPGSARWDVAEWDEAVWSSASWQDVTPYGVEVYITWGSGRPEFGILSTPDATSWAITFYDPDRVLDPANASSPYFGDLEPMLPVRLRLTSGQVIKQGFVESMSHRYEDDTGYWRVMDIQAIMANSVVPSDTTLADTLYERARDAIAAAGLSITVASDPPGGDPAVVAWETGYEATVWEWISDAAQQVLWVPYVREDNTLAFRDYRNPLDRAREIGSPNLVDMTAIVMHNGLFSIVTAGAQTREITPKPRFGAREYVREGVVDGTTPDDGAWAQAVLDDRAIAGLRWVPGRVVPFTADEVEYFAELEAIEQVEIDYPEANPPIVATGIIVGGEIRVRGKKDDDAIWEFVYHIAQAPLQPLVDDLDAESYLVRDDDPTEYLYPDV